jgi:hypothetical protein
VGQRLVGVDGSPLQVFGQAEVNATLKDKQFSTSILVVSPEAIVGVDFLQQYNATINLGDTELLIGCGQVTKIPLSKPPQPVRRLRVQLVDTIRIPPCSEVFVMASSADTVHTWLTEFQGARWSAGKMAGAPAAISV